MGLLAWFILVRVFLGHEDVLLAILCVAGPALAIWDAWSARRAEEGSDSTRRQSTSLKSRPAVTQYFLALAPIALLLFLWRSFGPVPFQIPTDSMMPTLHDGDFILVNKAAYGLRFFRREIRATGEPHRGDIVLFRPPFRPSQYWVKRVVGLPGDHVVVDDDQLIVKGKPAAFHVLASYSDGCYLHMELAEETLGSSRHDVLLCPEPLQLLPSLPSCKRTDTPGFLCGKPQQYSSIPDKRDVVVTVPKGEYLMIGDNRDNSLDGRYWGFVPEKDLVGKAVWVLFNFDTRTKAPIRFSWEWLPLS